MATVKHPARRIAALLAELARRMVGAGMGRDLSLVLLFKLAALGVLWTLFFSDAHQPSADAVATSRRLALAPLRTPLGTRSKFAPGEVP